MKLILLKSVSAFTLPRITEGIIYIIIAWPFLIRHFGEELVGELNLTITAATFASTFISTAPSSVLPSLLTKIKNVSQYWSYIKTSLFIIFFARLVILLIVLTTIFNTPLYNLINHDFLFLFGSLFLLSISRGISQTHLTLHGCYKTYFIIYSIKPILILPMNIYFAHHFGFYAFLVGYVVGEMVTTILEFFILVRNKNFSVITLSLKNNYKIFKQKGLFGLYNGGLETGMQFSHRLIITLFFGSATLGSLVILFQLFNFVKLCYAGLMQGLAKEIVKIISQSSKVKFTNLSLNFDFFIILSFVVILTSHYFYSQNAFFIHSYSGMIDTTFLKTICYVSILLPFFVFNLTVSIYSGEIIKIFKIRLFSYSIIIILMIAAGYLNYWVLFCIFYAGINVIECIYLSFVNKNTELILKMLLLSTLTFFYFQY